MARLFEPFQAPRTQRTRIDPAQLAQILAAPEVAKQQARASLFQELGQLPQTIFQTYSTLEQQQRARKLAPLELEEKQKQIDLLKAKAAALGKVGTVPIVDPETGEIKFEVPKGSKFAPGAAKKQERKLEIERIKSAFSELKELVSEVPAGPLGISGKFAVLRGKLRSEAPSAVAAVTASDFSRGPMRSLIAKVIGKDVGNLSQPEQEAAERIGNIVGLPQAQRDKKIALIDNLISAAESGQTISTGQLFKASRLFSLDQPKIQVLPRTQSPGALKTRSGIPYSIE